MGIRAFPGFVRNPKKPNHRPSNAETLQSPPASTERHSVMARRYEYSDEVWGVVSDLLHQAQQLPAEGGGRLQHPRTRAKPWFGGDRCLKNRLCCVKKLLIAARGDLLEFSRYSNFGHEGLVSVNILSISLAYCLG
ncbi:hypothetical protein D3C80_673520 [compost metagenome]